MGVEGFLELIWMAESGVEGVGRVKGFREGEESLGLLWDVTHFYPSLVLPLTLSCSLSPSYASLPYSPSPPFPRHMTHVDTQMVGLIIAV